MGIKLSARFDEGAPDSPRFVERTLNEDRITIGNDPAATIRLNGSVVSAEQVEIIDGVAGATLVNREAGTLLNGEILAANVQRTLRSGDVLCIGSYLIKIYLKFDPSLENRYELIVIDARSQRNADPFGAKHESDQDQEGPNDNSLVSPRQLDQSSLPGERRITPTKSFAAILDSLRTDEDRFYFVVEGGPQSGLRVPLESAEAPVGWDETGEQITFAPSAIANLCAVVRKDWSGVLIDAQTPTSVIVNGAPVEGTRRLKDGDRVLFGRRPSPNEKLLQVLLIFREPASLVILDSVMPRAVPIQGEPALLAAEDEASVTAVRPATVSRGRLRNVFKSDREYFGVFTFVELVLMSIGTLIGAVIIFLILNSS